MTTEVSALVRPEDFDTLRDVVALSMLPAMWSGAAPLRIAESLASALYATLVPGFIYVSFLPRDADGVNTDSIEVLQTSRYQTNEKIARALGPQVRAWALSHDPEDVLRIPNPLGSGSIGIRARALGIEGEFGTIAVGLVHDAAPHPAIDLILNVAASQAAIAIRNTRLLASLRESEDRIRESNIELSNANRRKDEFLAMLAHELRNPLSAIGNAVAFCRTPGAVAKLDHITELMGRQVKHLTHLIDDLLDVSRVTLGKVKLSKEVVPLSSLIAQAVSSVQSLIDERRHELSVHLPDAALHVEGDPTRIEQILENLITNAAKYSNPGGRIDIHVRDCGAEIDIEIRDMGLGISQEMLGQIFELFTQAHSSLDRSLGGLGIGLTLVKALVELHGGRISASSKGLGHGSTFTVRLPRGVSHREAATTAAIVPLARHFRQRVLLVDDNHDIVDSLSMLLEEVGYDVTIARDGRSAIAAFDEVSPDIALLDIGLPEIDGYQLAGMLRGKKAEGLLLIAISGYGQAADRHRAIAAGFDFHLTKPIDHASLFSLIGK